MSGIIGKILNFWVDGIVYSVSILVALGVVVTTILISFNKVGFFLLIFGGIVGGLIALVFLKKEINQKKQFERNDFMIFILSKSITTAALSVFIGKFFIPELGNIWQKSLDIYFARTINEAALDFIAMPIILSAVFIPSLLLIFHGIKVNREKKDLFSKYSFVFLACIYTIIITYFVGRFIDEKNFQIVAEKIVIFIVGNFVFVYWIYELFKPLPFPVKFFLYIRNYIENSKIGNYRANKPL